MFKELWDHFPKMLLHFTFLPTPYGFPISLHPCQYLLLSIGFSHPVGDSGVSLSFWFTFSWWLMMLSPFECMYWPFYFRKHFHRAMSIPILCPVLIVLLTVLLLSKARILDPRSLALNEGLTLMLSCFLLCIMVTKWYKFCFITIYVRSQIKRH